MIRPRLSPWRPSICRRLTAGATRTLAAPYTVQTEEATTASSTAAAAAAAAAAATEGLKRPRAKLVNGRAMAAETLDEVRRDVDLMRSKHGMAPGLAVIMVGERRDSAKYVSMKQAVAKSIGFESFSSSLPATATHKEVLECIQRYNGDPRCHGILLQLPVPAHLDPRGLLGAIKVEKDVECFNPTNAGRMTAWRRTVIAPCTPLGVMEMLLRLGVDVRGKHAVVLGESSVVGLPMCLLLNEARATVSMVNEDTPNPEEFTRRADIVVAATGVPELVRASWIKPGAVVIDVGMNFVRDDGRPAGFRIAGDVHSDVRQVASIVSPVPGGVGPMTVAMLMRNCANMAFLQSRWGTIAGALHPDLAAENARRMDSAIVDHALGSAGDQSSRSSRLRGGGGGAGEGGDDREEGGARLWAQGGGSSRLRGDSGGEGDREGEEEGEEGGGVRLEGGARDVEVAREALERAGESITDAELLTIINDSEKNAHDLLSFLELGSSNNQLVDANSSTVGAEAGAGVGPGGAGVGMGAGMGVGAGAGAGGDKRDRSWPPGFVFGAEKNPGRGVGGGGPVGGGGAFDCGEEMSMKALDEWQREARRAAKARGEAVLPHSKAQDLLLEDDADRPKTNSKWWVPPSKGEKVGGEEEDSGREGGGAPL